MGVTAILILVIDASLRLFEATCGKFSFLHILTKEDCLDIWDNWKAVQLDESEIAMAKAVRRKIFLVPINP